MLKIEQNIKGVSGKRHRWHWSHIDSLHLANKCRVTMDKRLSTTTTKFPYSEGSPEWSGRRTQTVADDQDDDGVQAKEINTILHRKNSSRACSIFFYILCHFYYLFKRPQITCKPHNFRKIWKIIWLNISDPTDEFACRGINFVEDLDILLDLEFDQNRSVKIDFGWWPSIIDDQSH